MAKLSIIQNPVPQTQLWTQKLNTHGVWKDNVDEDARAILCDKCELWYHSQCIESDIDYSAVANLLVSLGFVMDGCGFPNFVDSSLLT